MKTPLQIETVMTPDPHTIGKTLSITNAIQIMNKYQIHHLPVLEHGALVGVLSEQDLRELHQAPPKGGIEKLKVEDVMTPEPYMVTPTTPLNRVAQQMTEHKHACAVICHDNRKVIGIFTAIDALRVLHETLKSKEKTPRKRASGTS